MPSSTTSPMGAAVVTAIALAVTLLLALGAFTFFSIALPTRYKPGASPKEDRYQVLVLGDLGRSPRMQYHALSVVKCGAKVDLVGYKDSELHPALVDNARVGVYPVSPMPPWMPRKSALGLALKAIWQSLNLFYVLAYTAPAAKWIIIQNPPSIPTLHTAYIIAKLRGSKLMVDWHNYGYSIMDYARGHNPEDSLVRLYMRYETFFGRIVPDVSITVTDAMARDMRKPPFKMEKPILTMHDRPAGIFQPITSPEKREKALAKLPQTRDCVESIMNAETRLVVSSTSWTPDEDLDLLLQALLQYGGSPVAESSGKAHKLEKTRREKKAKLLVIITGKGPLKAAFEERIAALEQKGHLPSVTIKTAFLPMEDYASLLACADLGVCLHESTSGVDLPMKVLDMFGAGLPVAAFNKFGCYESFGELVREGSNGWGFTDAEELVGKLDLFNREGGEEELRRARGGALKEGGRRWDDEWEGVVGRALELV